MLALRRFFARHCKTTIAADLTCRLMKGPMLCRCSTRGYEGAGTHRPKAYTHMRLHGDTNMNHASWNTGCADSMRGRSHIDCPGVICNSLLCFQSGAHTGRATSAAAKALQEPALKWIGALFHVLVCKAGQCQSRRIQMIRWWCGPNPAACA